MVLSLYVLLVKKIDY